MVLLTDKSRELEMAKMAWRDFLHAHADECDVDAVVDLIVATTASIEDAKCQQRVERIFREIEEVAVTAPFHDEQPPTMYWQMSTTEWQALKKREQVSDG